MGEIQLAYSRERRRAKKEKGARHSLRRDPRETERLWETASSGEVQGFVTARAGYGGNSLVRFRGGGMAQQWAVPTRLRGVSEGGANCRLTFPSGETEIPVMRRKISLILLHVMPNNASIDQEEETGGLGRGIGRPISFAAPIQSSMAVSTSLRAASRVSPHAEHPSNS